MTYGIVSDSSCDLSAAEVRIPGIHFGIVPLKIIVDGTEYVDNENIDVHSMLSHMKRFKGASGTSCPSPGEWAEEFRKSDCTLAVTISGALSGSYQSAVMGRDIVLEENPERKIEVIDSRSAAGDMVLIIRRASELITKGVSFDEVVLKIREYSDELRLLFTLSSYDTLIKSGRMSRVIGLLANGLGIRAIAQKTPEGTIEVLHKPRGENRAIAKLVEVMQEIKDLRNKPIVINHCNNPEGANMIKGLIEKCCHAAEITILSCRGLTSFYAGEAGLIVSF